MTSFNLECKVVSPLTQIDKTDQAKDGTNIIKIKSITIAADTGTTDEEGNPASTPVRIPVYTGNGLRGLLRRKAAEIIAQKAREKHLSLTRSNFHLFFAGGGNNYPETPDIQTENRIRKLNPLVSLFGASLALESKLIVSNLVPSNPLITFSENGAYSKAIQNITIITKDDLLDHTKFSRFISTKEIDEWIRYNLEEQAKRKQDREDNVSEEEKTKKGTIRNIIRREYIVPGTVLTGSIAFKTEPTKVELGLLISALKEASREQLGSSAATGCGFTEWIIHDREGYIMLETKRNPDFIYQCSVNYDKEYKGIKEFNNWLNNLKQENISIAEILKPAGKDNEKKNKTTN